MQVEQDMIGAAISRIPSGCSILAAAHDDRRSGVLVSWVQQVAFDPPSIIVSLKRSRPIIELVDASQKFLLNVIGDHSTSTLEHFAKGFSVEEDAFEGLAFRTTGFGPIIESCIAHLKCEIRQKIPVGDHELYVAEITGAGVVDDAKPYIHIRKNGMSY